VQRWCRGGSEKSNKIHTKSPKIRKFLVEKVVGCRQASSEPLPGLLNFHFHPSKLLSARANPARENIGQESRFVVRLVRLVRERSGKRSAMSHQQGKT
jgi:hypothetical protein